MAPLVTLPNNVVPINGSLQFQTLFLVTNLTPNRPIQIYRFRDNGIGGGFFTVGGSTQPANQWIEVSPIILNSVFYRGAQQRLTESISVQVWDGVEWSNIATASISTGNSRPIITAQDGRTVPLERILISNQFTYFDADGDAPVSYSFMDSDAGPNSGFFELFGVRQPSGQFFTITAAQLSGLRYRGGTVPGLTENIMMTANDGFSTSAVVTFEMRVSGAPDLVPTEFDVYTNERLDARRLFRYSDPDGDAAVTYQFVDRRINANGGFFEFKGQRMPSAVWFTVPAAELNQVVYIGASAGFQTENIGISVYDGFQFSNTEVAVNTHARQSLSVQANHFLNIETGRKANAVLDPNLNTNPFLFISESVQRMRILDRKSNLNGGRFIFKGVEIPQGLWFTIQRNSEGSFELDQLEYRGGTWGLQSENIVFQTFSNGIWGELNEFNVDTLRNANRPVLRLLNLNSRVGSVFPMSIIHSVSDADGDLMTRFAFYDTGASANSGFFTINGVQQPALTWIELPYSQIDSVRYHMPTVPGTEQVRMWVSDGTWQSAIQTSTFQAVEVPRLEPIRTDISLDTLESRRVSDLFQQVDAGPPHMRYQVFDENFQTESDRSARFYLRVAGAGNHGQVLLPGVVHNLTAEQFSRLEIQGAEADRGRSLDGFLVRTSNNITGWSDWRRINVNTDPTGPVALTSGTQFSAVTAGVKTVVTYSFIDGGNQGNSGRDNPNRPPLPFYYPSGPDTPEALNPIAFGQPARESLRQIFRDIETFAHINFVEVPYQWNVANAAIITGLWGPFDGGVAGAAAYAYLPFGGDGRATPIGDIWFNRGDYEWNTTDVAPGSRSGGSFHFVAMHEIGHALGLKHPFEGVPSLSIFNDYDYNTVMSYQSGIGVGFPTNPIQQQFPGIPASFMLYDMVELQRLYGANSNHRSGNDSYTFARPTPATPVLQRTLWDGGGDDTLNLGNSLTDENLDLREGTWSTIHGVPQALRIAYGTQIEHARGGAGNDTIRGNESFNMLFGGDGDDILIGMGGNDWLFGGLGDDTYRWSLGDGHDRISEEGGRDIVEFYDASGSISSFDDDFIMRRLGNDLRIDVTLDRGQIVGSTTIANYHQAASRVEVLRMFSRGVQVGPDIDLTSAWNHLGTFGRYFTVTSQTTSFGAVLAPV